MTSNKILGIIDTESAYGVGQNQETGLGEVLYSPPYLSPCPPPHQSPPRTSPYQIPPPQSSPTVPPQPSQTPRRRPTKNDFLASDESTRSVLKEINNNLKISNDLKEIQMRRQLTERLHKYRQGVRKHLGN